LKGGRDVNYVLKDFETSVCVSRIANIHYFEFAERYKTTPASHDFCELIYIDKGTLGIESEGFHGVLEGNCLLIHRAGEVHSLHCDGELAPGVIIVGFECSCRELDPFSTQPVRLSAGEKKLLSEILKDGMSVYAPPYDMPNTSDMQKRSSYPFGADQLLKNHLEELLICLVRRRKEEGSFLDVKDGGNTVTSHVTQYLNEHYAEKIALESLCFLFATNKTTLCREFKEEHGMTVLQYVNALRIKEAKRLLRMQRYTATEIAERVGFASLHYFSRVFKAVAGVSPQRYLDTVLARLEAEK
jgi:AraC-like DNA-binding protein